MTANTLSGLIAGFVRRHWPAYAASALMLAAIAALTAWIPRKIGAMIDGLAAARLGRTELELRVTYWCPRCQT